MKYKIASAIIKDGDKFLIGRRASDKDFAPNQWEFISGFLEPNESPQETIVREIKEELKAEGNIQKEFPKYLVTDEEGSWEVFPFLFKLSNPKSAQLTSDHSELKWVTLSELQKVDELHQDINSLKEYLK